MCIVIDINSLAAVFNENCDRHCHFKVVKDWIFGGKGFLVYGGTRFKKELSKSYRYLRLIRQMKDAGQAVAVRDDIVDLMEDDVLAKTADTTCDDQHIIALLGASWCPLFCSDDSRSYEFIKNRALYPAGMPKIRIYSSLRNKRLLRPMSKSILKNLI